MLLQSWLASTAPFYSNFSVQLGNSLFQLNFLRRLVKEIRSYFPLEPIFWHIQNLAENKYCQWIVKLCNIAVTEYLQTNCRGDVDEDLDTTVTCETSRLPSPFDLWPGRSPNIYKTGPLLVIMLSGWFVMIVVCVTAEGLEHGGLPRGGGFRHLLMMIFAGRV